MKKLYEFYWNCGRMGSVYGSIEGLGHDLTLLTDDLDFIAKAQKYKLIPSGYNPLEYLREEE